MKVRCSSLPAFWECPSSVIEATMPYKPNSEEADLGTEVHARLATLVSGGSVKPSANSEVDKLVSAGMKLWREQLENYFVDQVTELEMDSDLFTGHADLAGSLTIIDWKTGRSQKSHQAQMGGYASLYRSQCLKGKLDEHQKITTVVAWLRTGELEVKTWDNAQLDAFEADYKSKLDLVGKQYGPGEACTWCQRQHQCAARELWTLSAAKALAEVPKAGALTRELLADLYPKAKLLKKALDQYDDALRSELERGELKINDGAMLRLVEETRDEIDPLKSWPKLAGDFGSEELSSVVKITKTSLMDLVASRAKQWGVTIKQAKEDYMFALRESGAVKTTTIRKIQAGRG